MNKIKLLSTSLLLLAGTSFNVLAQDKLTAVHAFPTSLVYTESFLSFVEKVNEAGKGIVQINVLGGPEVIGLSQQPDAVRNGVVDMAYTAASFYAGTIPERDALIASNTNAVYARESGGIDLLNEIHQKKMGVYYLGWFDSGVKYNLYTVDKPKVKENGDLDISGMKLRSNPVYDAFFQSYLGAKPISLPTTDVYAALERSVSNATGWTEIGLKDLGWNKFLNYRITPSFLSTDMGTIVNLKSWQGLSKESQDLIQRIAIEHERDSAEKFSALGKQQLTELERDGMQEFALDAEAAERFSRMARTTSWERMRKQMERHPMGLEYYDELISKFNE
jgi:TRAP-type C4-dicarboxylate transport system substrate-binding protein